MRINDDDLVTEHLNAFNTIISQLLIVDIKITEEENGISLMCCFLDSQDNLVMDLSRNNTTLKIGDVVAALLSEEMR